LPRGPKAGLVRQVGDLAKAHPALVAFGVALVPRLLFLFELRARSPTFEAPEGGDSILYDRLASGVPAAPRAYFHSPFYIAFLKALYRTLGRDLFAVRLVQHVAGALACALVAHVTLKALHSRTYAVYAGLGAAVLGPLVFYEGQIGMDALMPFLVMACVALAFSAWRKRTLVSFALLGCAVGTAALGRAVVLAWLPLFAVWCIASGRGGGKRLAALLAGTTLAILPATVHNWRVEGVFVPITANFGLNLYIGNNEAADGAYVLPRGVAFRPGDPADDFEGRRVAEQSEGRPLTSAELSTWWSARAWAFVRSEPRWAARLVLEKIRILANVAEYPQLHDYDAYSEVAPVLAVLPTGGFVVVPGLAGLLTLVGSRERRPLAKRLAALTVAFAASFLPFFVVGRYRAPWLLLLVPFAIGWIGRVTAAWARAEWRSVLAHVALVGVLTWFSSQTIAMPNPSFQYMEFARASAARGDREGAADWCFRALAREPGRADAAALLGRIRRDEGRYQEAAKVLETALETNPGAAVVWLELGFVRMDTERYDAGVEAFLSSVDADPRSVDAWAALASALRAAGRDDEAMAAESSAERLRSAASVR
jgi:hypothetical protein